MRYKLVPHYTSCSIAIGTICMFAKNMSERVKYFPLSWSPCSVLLHTYMVHHHGSRFNVINFIKFIFIPYFDWLRSRYTSATNNCVQIISGACAYGANVVLMQNDILLQVAL